MPRASTTSSAATACSTSSTRRPAARVLEIACGTGRNLVSAARRYPDARLYGFDISAAMLDTARAAIARRGLDDRIALCLGDATDFSGDRAVRGAGVRSRVHLLCAVDDPAVARRAAPGAERARAGRPAATSSTSASRRSCRAGSGAACAPGSPSSRSSRAPSCRPSLQRWPRSRMQLRSEQLYRGYATYAVLEKPR